MNWIDILKDAIVFLLGMAVQAALYKKQVTKNALIDVWEKILDLENGDILPRNFVDYIEKNKIFYSPRLLKNLNLFYSKVIEREGFALNPDYFKPTKLSTARAFGKKLSKEEKDFVDEFNKIVDKNSIRISDIKKDIMEDIKKDLGITFASFTTRNFR